jgi:hypothetical protein
VLLARLQRAARMFMDPMVNLGLLTPEAAIDSISGNSTTSCYDRVCCHLNFCARPCWRTSFHPGEYPHMPKSEPIWTAFVRYL